jgi:hypothetical protein
MAAFVIRTGIHDLTAAVFTPGVQKTMYGGKRIAAGDTIFVFASENAGGRGLVARGVVLRAAPVPKPPDAGRQAPRVRVTIGHLARAARALGRGELRPFRQWDDGQPQTELNFKLYRQATDKIVGIAPATAAFLHGHFEAPPDPA